MQRIKSKDQNVVPPSPPRLLRRSEVAERLSVSLRTVDKLSEQGFLEKVRFPGRVRGSGFREGDVNVLLSAGHGGQPASPA
jgi:hypothetical protein